MKQFLWFSAFTLVISSAMAQTGASPKATLPVSTQKKTASPARVSSKEVQELRDALAAQQKQADEQRQQLDQLKSQLQQLLDATQQASASAQKVQGSAEHAQTTAAQAQQSATDAQRLADQASSSAAEAKAATMAPGGKTTGQRSGGGLVAETGTQNSRRRVQKTPAGRGNRARLT